MAKTKSEKTRRKFTVKILPFNTATHSRRTVTWRNPKELTASVPVRVGQTVLGSVERLWQESGWLYGEGTIELSNVAGPFAIEPGLKSSRYEVIDADKPDSASVVIKDWDLEYIMIGDRPAWPESQLWLVGEAA